LLLIASAPLHRGLHVTAVATLTGKTNVPADSNVEMYLMVNRADRPSTWSTMSSPYHVQNGDQQGGY